MKVDAIVALTALLVVSCGESRISSEETTSNEASADGSGGGADAGGGLDAGSDTGAVLDGSGGLDAGEAGSDGDARDETSIWCATQAITGPQPLLAWRLTITSTNGSLYIAAERAPAYRIRSPEPSVTPVTTEGAATGQASSTSVSLTFQGWTVEAAPTSASGLLAGTGTFGDDGELQVTCWAANVELPFGYDAQSGVCSNDDGSQGLNVIPLPYARETSNAHCADLTGVYLNEDDLGYPQLTGWDLRGADLSSAQLSFAYMYDAKLEGTNMATLQYGYAVVTGSTDAHTVVPESGSCTNEGGALRCVR